MAIKWDYKIGDEIKFFDPTKSYELSGYRPISLTGGLDFDPNWFKQAGNNKDRTGKYTNFPSGSRAYRIHWVEEMARCLDGYNVNGYRLTGDHYFFINYYVLPNVKTVQQAGAGRDKTTAEFWAKHYEYFHYVDICEKLGKDVIALKARGVEACPPLQ